MAPTDTVLVGCCGKACQGFEAVMVSGPGKTCACMIACDCGRDTPPPNHAVGQRVVKKCARPDQSYDGPSGTPQCRNTVAVARNAAGPGLLELVASGCAPRQGLCRLVVFADLGQSYNSSSTLDHMAQSLNSDTLTGAAAHLVYVPQQLMLLLLPWLCRSIAACQSSCFTCCCACLAGCLSKRVPVVQRAPAQRATSTLPEPCAPSMIACVKLHCPIQANRQPHARTRAEHPASPGLQVCGGLLLLRHLPVQWHLHGAHLPSCGCRFTG